jgi:hypothetical protein
MFSKKKLKIGLFASLLFGTSTQVHAEVRGVQAVLLHCWTATSRNAMRDVLLAQNDVVISSAPFAKVQNTNGTWEETCRMPATQTNRLGNIARLIDDLKGIPELHIILFAGYVHESSANSDLAANFAQIWNVVKKYPNASNLFFHLGASLEDRYTSSAVDSVLRKMREGVPTSDINLFNAMVLSGHLVFHRSAVAGNGNPDNTEVAATPGYVAVPVDHEFHGGTPPSQNLFANGVPKYRMWSNDGPFVYFNHRVGAWSWTEECANNCGVAEKPLSLATFKGSAFNGGYRILWRPAYNLFPYTDSNHKRTFTKSATPRQDAGNAGFDSWEQDVLLAFFQAP